MWRIIFWLVVTIMTIGSLCLYYFDEKIGNLKTQIASNQKNEAKLLVHIETLRKFPKDYDNIYKQLETMELPSELYPKFRELVPIINKFCADNNRDPLGPNFEDLHNRTIPLLLDKFPNQVYSDETLDYEFNNRSQLYYLNEHRRSQLISVLHNVILQSSIDQHRFALRGMIYDLFWYSPDLLNEFKSVFGQEKLNEIKKSNLWTGQDLKGLADECRTALVNFGVIDTALLK